MHRDKSKLEVAQGWGREKIWWKTGLNESGASFKSDVAGVNHLEFKILTLLLTAFVCGLV